MATLDEFTGVWVLDPASCRYDEGLPIPTSGVYTLLHTNDAGSQTTAEAQADAPRLWVHIRWRIAEAPIEQTSYLARVDGQAQAIDEPEGPTMATALDGDALVSEVALADQPLHLARRTVSGERMRVVQRVRAGDAWRTSEAEYVRAGVKQTLVYRRDLKMRKGKIAAQCAHASMAVFFRRKRDAGRVSELVIPLDGPMAAWVGGRFTKVCLSVEGEAELLAAHAAARDAGLPCALITDAGRTEFRGVPTRTALAIGPAANPEIDAITGPGGPIAAKLA